MRLVIFLSFSFSILLSQSAFISAVNLKSSFADKKLVLIDVSEMYKVGHISGAISFDVKYLINKTKSYSALKSHKRLQDIFSNIGLKNDSNIVIYGRNNFKDLKHSAFLAFALISSGFEKVSILDGGYMSWVFEYDSLIDEKVITLSSGEVNLTQKNLTVEAKQIKNIENIIDARDKNKYDISHISGATSCSYRIKFRDDFTLLPNDKIKNKCVGYLANNTNELIIYSDDIFTSSLEWYIVNRVLGFSNAKIYYNSFDEYKDLELDIIADDL